MITEAKAIKNEGFTKESWDALQNKIAEAEELASAENADANDVEIMNEEPDRVFNIAVSGGNTPALMFDLWANEYMDITPWDRMRIYWVDERCVPAEDYESNYGTMRRLLLDEVGMPDEYVYPIYGVNRPEIEAKNYSTLVCRTVPLWGGFPAFDVVLLGAGDDGHTSSIFPGQEYLLSSFHPYEVSVNPYNGRNA